MFSTLRTNGFRWISGRLAHLPRQHYPLHSPVSASKGRRQTTDIVTIRSRLRHHSSGVRPEHLRTFRTVKTLDSRALALSDMVDMSNMTRPHVSFGGPGSKPVSFLYKYTGSVKSGTGECHPFPPASEGFFYFHRKPGRESNIFSGELRFRVVVNPSDSQLSADKLFANGHDLLDYTGLAPWRIHMVKLYSSKRYKPILDLLVHQGLTSSEHVAEGKRVVPETRWGPVQARILEDVTDEFVISLPSGNITLTLPRNDAMTQYILYPSLGLYEKGGSQSVPRQYHGKATVRLELARAPATETRKEHIAMAVRVLRLSDQQGPTPYHLPDGGELLQRSPGFVRYFRLKDASKHLLPSGLEALERKYLPGILL
ncbi:hypothetical protein DFP72DRAFT_286202 [Ephemerocybe angulata]|uniref:Uncharacterized protein n=1 Tax=Ephemerocybe angulata TaxID=980116 RepID=A0A8H6M8Y1_9AGAR|nr:hypothetical protein DFP72DRAFT_286202 [Tulosesus angulatus]